ncbi:MAG: oligopeptide:H+ symporter [Micrococcaceae bacterium]
MEEKKSPIKNISSIEGNTAELFEAEAMADQELEENNDIPTDTSFFGHPKQMATLFGVETWERFSYYGLQGIVLLYMYYTVSQGGLGMSQAAATSIVGAYGGGSYLAAVANSWIADRLLGRERVLFISAIMVMCGHLTLALGSGVSGLALGIFLIAYGAGGVKSCSTSIVGSLYPKGDVRLNSGFALYYLGVNLGGLIGPLLTGWLQTSYGFHYGFGIAAFGMAIGLTQYAINRKHLPKSANTVTNPLADEERKKFYMGLAGIILFFVIAFATRIITIDDASNVVIVLAIIAAVVLYSTIIRSPKVNDEERSRVYASIPLVVSQVGFWSLYQQQFTVLTIYADQRLNRHIGNWEMPVAWVQSINPVYIILLSGFFAGLWAKWKGQPRTSAKFGWANIFIGLAYFMFLPFANGGPNSAPILLIAAILFVFTIGEMFISPTGLAVSTQLAPKAFITQFVAIFFLASAIGTSAAGSIAGFYNPNNEVPYFTTLGIASIILGGIIFALNPWINKRMKGVL